MIEFSRRYVSIFGFEIYFYGAIIAIGALLAIVVAVGKLAERGWMRISFTMPCPG